MTGSQRLVSAFIVFHVVALSVGATPSPAELPEPGGTSRSLPGLRGVVTTVLDSAVATLRPFHAFLYDALAPVRPAARLYLGATGQYERWNMFSRPVQADMYVHLRYYVAAPASRRLRADRELVFPAHPPGRPRVLAGFADSFTDKAIDLSLQSFETRLDRARRAGHDDEEALALAGRELAPLMRFFARRYADRALPPGGRLVRVELWRGSAPMAPLGQAWSPDRIHRRYEALDAYDAATYGGLVAGHPLPPGTLAEDADIRWQLLAAETF